MPKNKIPEWVTVGRMIDILQNYDSEMKLVITRDGKGHQTPVMRVDIQEKESCYFSNPDVNDDNPFGFLNIGTN